MKVNQKNYPIVFSEKESRNFWAKVDKNGPWSLRKGCPKQCWIWIASVDKDGYGRFGFRRDGKTHQGTSHRISYTLFKGEVKADLKIDHLCRNEPCVNPDHLEPVTNRVNIIRGETIMAKNFSKSECPRGHKLEPPNLRKSGSDKGYRRCLSCGRANSKYRYAKISHGIILDPNLFQQVADEYYREIMSGV